MRSPRALPARTFARLRAGATGGARGGVLALFSGSAAGVALTYAAQPILTRLFTAEAFGVADLFAAVVSVLFPVASLRYEDALTLPEDDGDAAHLFWLAVALSLGACALLLLAPLLAPSVARVPGYRALVPLLPLLAPALLALRALRLTEAWCTRAKEFGPMATSNAIRAGATSAYRLGAGFGGAAGAADGGAAALTHAFVAGTALGALVQGVPLARRPGALGAPISFKRMSRLASRYHRFALLATPATLLHNLAGRLPFFGLALVFSPDVVGYFGRVFLVVATPLGLVGGAVSRVFAAHAPQARRDGTLPDLAARFHDRLVALGLYPTLALCAFGPDLFAFVFGEAWREAGVYATVAAPWLYLAAVASPLTALFDVTEQHRLDLFTSVALFAGLSIALFAGSLTGLPRMAVLAVGLSGASLRVLHLWLLLGAAGVTGRRALRPYGWGVGRSAAGLGLAVLVRMVAGPLFGAPPATFGGVAGGAALYYSLVLAAEGPRKTPPAPER